MTLHVRDAANNEATCTATLQVNYNFTGFFKPVDNPPALNIVNAGQGVPVQFSLGSDKGLDIFAAGYPVSQQISCDTLAPEGDPSAANDAGSSGLSYDPATNTYTFVWQTDQAWDGFCRQFTVGLNDGTFYMANFHFGKKTAGH